MATFNDVDTFIHKINLDKEKEEEVNLLDFDTIILDADETIWDITTPQKIGIAAKDTTPPYIRQNDNPNLVIDSQNNQILLKDGFLSKLRQLKLKGKELYIVSYSDKIRTKFEEQPVVLILKTFDIFKLFEDIIIDDEIPKSESILNIDDGNSVFIDDNDKNLIDVSIHTNVKTIDPKEHKNIFSWYFKAIKAEAKNIDENNYEEIRKKIEQDLKYSKENIFTLRDNDGELNFRVNLNNGEILQVNPEFRKINPKIYDGMKLPKHIIDNLDEANKEKLNSYNNRIRLLDKHYKPSEIRDFNVIELLSNDKKITEEMVRYNLIDRDNVDENKLEEFLNELEILPKFMAGVASAYLFFKNGSIINQIEAKNLAEQIANKEIFGSFNGEEEFRQKNNIDFIPNEKTYNTVTVNQYFKSPTSIGNDKIEYLKDNIQNQIEKMNLWIEQGMYMYEDQSAKQFSKPFKKQFGYFIEQCANVDSLTEQLYNKMKKIAGSFIS